MQRLWLVVLATACAGETPSGGECALDTDCIGEGSNVCHQQECVPRAKLDCVAGGSKTAAIAVRPEAIDFGQVGGSGGRATIEIDNGGECTLQVRSLAIVGGVTSRFSCVSCATTSFPRDVLPGRTLSLELMVAAGPPGSLMDELIIASSDLARTELAVPLTAQSLGEPKLVVTPRQIDFGYVPVGRTKDASVQVINAASGSASLFITNVTLEGDAAFSFTPSPFSPVELGPALDDPSARLAITVRYAPSMDAAHAASLTVTPEIGDPIVVALSGAEDPPNVMVTPASIAFGDLLLGSTAQSRVTIQNTGVSPLVATRSLQIGHPDVSIPRQIPEVRPGGVYELDVLYQATLAGPMSDSILIETNDPDTPSITIPLSGMGQPSGNDVVALELRFENDSETLLDADLRDVDLILESPDGQVCRELSPSPSWGAYGNPRWSATGAKENPERILLPDSMQDGRYEVTLSYIEDCSTLPTGLAADLLGIGADELIDYLSEGGVGIDPDMLSDAVAQTCINRSAPEARIAVTINGAVVSDMPVDLRVKGDLVNPFALVRTNGSFAIE